MWKCYGKLFKAEMNRKRVLQEKIEDVKNHNLYVQKLSESKKLRRAKQAEEEAKVMQEIEDLKQAALKEVEEHFEKMKEDAKKTGKASMRKFTLEKQDEADRDILVNSLYNRPKTNGTKLSMENLQLEIDTIEPTCSAFYSTRSASNESDLVSKGSTKWEIIF